MAIQQALAPETTCRMALSQKLVPVKPGWEHLRSNLLAETEVDSAAILPQAARHALLKAGLTMRLAGFLQKAAWVPAEESPIRQNCPEPEAGNPVEVQSNLGYGPPLDYARLF